MKSQLEVYRELEFAIHSESDAQRKPNFASRIARILERIVESIIAVNELKIHSPKSKSGSAYWVIHDSLLGHKICLSSEQEVRTWLDKRYYQ